MSKKARTRSRLADLDADDINVDRVKVQDKSEAPQERGLTIREKYQLSPMHKTFLELCLYEKTKMVFVDGPAGTAKTFLAVKAGLHLLKEKRIKHIVYIRSIVESATKSIGALPGELDEKFKPWSMPLLEKLGELTSQQNINSLMEDGVIKCIPVNFVRGLTFHDSLVILDEAQNMTHEECVTILTRFGHNSTYIVLGDARQADIGYKSGFNEIYRAFDTPDSAEEGIHTMRFGEAEIVRSKILRFIVSKIETMRHKKITSAPRSALEPVALTT